MVKVIAVSKSGKDQALAASYRLISPLSACVCAMSC